MDGSGTNEQSEDGETVDFTLKIDNGQSKIRVSGDRDTAVVVRSPSGEKIYLPPEDFDRPASRGGSTYDSPYQPQSGAQASPYQTHPDAASVRGLEPTQDGFVIVHPEPITDLRFLR